MDENARTGVDAAKTDEKSKRPTKGYPAGCLRSVVLFPVGTILSVLVGLALGQSVGTLWGIVIGIVVFLLLTGFVVFIVNRSSTLTIVDCVLPFVISIVAAFAFAPFALLTADVFSIPTCIFSGVLLSVGLILYRAGKLPGAYLVIPMLTFVYEILPISLPSDLDDFIALGADTANMIVGTVVPAWMRKRRKFELPDS